MNTYDISYMELNDIEESAQVLSLAMLNNPIHVAVFQGESENERQTIEQIFLELFTEHPGIVFVAKDQGKIIGVMRMISCVGKKVSETIELNMDSDIKTRQAFWFNEWEKRDPKDQHWHLGPIGVLPSHRKQGVGSKLMKRFCNEVDNCSSKAYLETDLDENVKFYRTFGFKLISKSIIFQVENKYMIRSPKPDFLNYENS